MGLGFGLGLELGVWGSQVGDWFLGVWGFGVRASGGTVEGER